MLCVIGGALGVGAALISLRAVKAVIPIERSQDLPALLLTVIAVTTVALLASYGAVRRAARIDPSDLLWVQ